MADENSSVVEAFAHFRLPAQGQEFELPLRGPAEDAATNNGAKTITGNSATYYSSLIANPDAASAISSGRPINPKSQAFDAETRKKEADLRFQAIRWMAKRMEDYPHGRIVYPPPWYRPDEDPSSIAHNRPVKWIKDRKTEKLRPCTERDGFKPLGRPDINAKKRKATMEPESDPTTKRVDIYDQERPVPAFRRHRITSSLTLNPMNTISVEANIDSGYHADVESD